VDNGDSIERIRTLVVDDEKLARTGLRAMLAVDPALVTNECAGGTEAVRLLRGGSFDLAFLDIQMPKLNGFEIIEAVGVDRMPVTVFTTAHSEHAIAAFEACALDYLLKPIREARLARTLVRAKEVVRQRQLGRVSNQLASLLARIHGERSAIPRVPPDVAVEPNDSHARRILLRSGQSSYYIDTDDVDWVEADGYYARIWVGVRSHLLRQSLSQLELTLDPARFVRVHRSALVNVARVVSIRKTGLARYAVQLSTGTVVPLSRERKGELHQVLRRRA
jgi:two-component system LytT family response regulator